MQRPRSALSSFLLIACAVAPLFDVGEAQASAPPPDGGAADLQILARSVVLNRHTYYVGEAITGTVEIYGYDASDPIFLDSLGNPVNGTLTYLDPDGLTFVFVPDPPLAVGPYTVNLDSFEAGTFDVVAGEPAVPSYRALFEESPAGSGTPLRCASYVPGYESVESYPQTRVDALLRLRLEGQSSDQYSYEYSLDGAARLGLPESGELTTVREGNGEVCVEIFAKSYVDASEVSLGSTCVDPDATLTLGLLDEPFGDLGDVLPVCELPPDGYKDQWCDYFAAAFTNHSCDAFIFASCEEARYECPGGDLPEWYDANGIDPNDPNRMGGGSTTSTTPDGGTGSDESSDEAGCGCTTGVGRGATGNLALLLAGLGGALVALRRRARNTA